MDQILWWENSVVSVCNWPSTRFYLPLKKPAFFSQTLRVKRESCRSASLKTKNETLYGHFWPQVQDLPWLKLAFHQEASGFWAISNFEIFIYIFSWMLKNQFRLLVFSPSETELPPKWKSISARRWRRESLVSSTASFWRRESRVLLSNVREG